MELFLNSACPECGAASRRKEGIITFKCPYCASALRVKEGTSVLKYIIPRRVPDGEIPAGVKRAVAAGKAPGLTRIRKIFTAYKPFWYFKGMLFYSHADAASAGGPPDDLTRQREIGMRGDDSPAADVVARMWSHTMQANTAAIPPFFTLGIQSEVLQLEPYDSEAFSGAAHIIPVTVTAEEANRTAAAAALNSVNIDRKQYQYGNLSLIGEKLFIIYYPVAGAVCESKGGYTTALLDGINRNFICCAPGKDPAEMFGTGDPAPFKLEMLAHRCPNCGVDLEPGDFNLAFYCRNCFSLWLLDGGDYHPLKKKAIDPGNPQNTVFIPFWKFEAALESQNSGLNARTVGDFARLIKGGDLYLRNAKKENPIRFYVPAMVAKNATALLKLAVRVTIAQKEMPFSEMREFSYGNFFGASLPEREAREMLPVIAFSAIGRTDRRTVDLYRDMRVTGSNAELVWYPFTDDGTMLSDRFLNFTIARKGLEAALG